MKSKVVLIAVTSAIAATVALVPAAAFATSYGQNYPGLMCKNYSGGVGTINSAGQVANENSTNLTLFCPIVSNDTSISSAGMWFYSNGGAQIAPGYSIEATLCYIDASGGSGACGTTKAYAGTAGSQSWTNIDTSEYNYNEFNYLIVELGGPAAGPSYNVLFGYEVVLAGS
jgi:hypothetical protein